MDLDEAADALYDAIRTRVFREEFREIYARLAAAATLNPDEARSEALRNWPDGAEGLQAEMYRREVRAAFERGAAWQSRHSGFDPAE